jgi:hypothetical protein
MFEVCATAPLAISASISGIAQPDLQQDVAGLRADGLRRQTQAGRGAVIADRMGQQRHR